MRQTGQIKGVKDGAIVNFSHKVTVIFTKQDGTKITRDTNATGGFDFDVPIGEYFISAFVTDTTEKKTNQFRAGLLFIVNAQTKINALDIWIGGGDIESKDPMQDWWVAQFAEAKKNADEAKAARDEIKNNSIGDANGKWLKEGASKSDFLNTFGNYYSQDIMPYLKAGDTGLSYAQHFKTKNTGLDFANTGINKNEFLYYEVQRNYIDASSLIEFKGYGGRAIYAQSYKRSDGTWLKPVVFYNQENAKVDKNNVLHATTGTPKDTLITGDYGLGGYNTLSVDFKKGFHAGMIFGADASSASSEFGRAGALLHLGAYASGQFQLHLGIDDKIRFRRGEISTGVWRDANEVWTTVNTTVDSNGFIKKASPIIKLFDDHIEWNQDFKEEPIFEKLDIGVYKISNTNGLARGITHGDWYIETPKNRNGLPYFMVEWEQDAITDDVTIKVFDRKFDINIGDFINGEPRDIGKDERWIDLRFHEQIYSLTNELPELNIPYHPLWGIEPYKKPEVINNDEDVVYEELLNDD